MNHYITKRFTLLQHYNIINIKSIILILCILTFISSPNAIGQDKKGFVHSISVKDKWFGAKGDGIADDTASIQKAVDFIYNRGGGVINFPAGTYLVTSVNIREGITYQGHGATIKRPEYLTDKIGPKAAKGVRTFTNQKNPYAGQMDSRPLIIKGLTFDGSSQTQGPYQNYELEQAALLFLMGNNKFPGRLTAIIEDCIFKNGVGDGVHAFVNTDIKMHNCLAENVFRGGFVLTGGYSKADVENLTTRGKIDPTGIDIEVDANGYGHTRKVEVYFKNLNLLDGDFDIGVSDGSQVVVKKAIVLKPPVALYFKQSSGEFYDCQFKVGLGNRIVHPFKVVFNNCEFSAVPEGKGDKVLSAAPFIAWNLSKTTEKDQSVIFNNCKFRAGESARSFNGPVHGILTGWDPIDFNNILSVNGGYFSAQIDIGIATRFRGGNWRINGALMEAKLPFAWTGFETAEGKTDCNILINNVKIKSKKYMHITGYRKPTPNRLEHLNVALDESANYLSSDYGLEGNQYVGHRVILGTAPPTPATHGLVGDLYRLKNSPSEWVCMKAGYFNEKAKRRIDSSWQPQ